MNARLLMLPLLCVFATTLAGPWMDAGWLTLTTTSERAGGFANILRDVFILNRDRSELTVWRTLNVRRPDGAPDKIDCGNHVAPSHKDLF